MIIIDNGLDQPKWSLSLRSTDSQGVKRTRTVSGINLVLINATAQIYDQSQDEYPVIDATGYTAREVDDFARELILMLGETFETDTLVGKFLLNVI